MRDGFTENTNTIKINNKEIEKTEKYIYLGQTITNDHDQTIELHRRIGLGWSAFGRFKNILVNERVKPETKKRIFDEIILPTMTYACQIWSLSDSKLEALCISQRISRNNTT